MSDRALFWGVMLARDIEVCRALLRGEHVDPARLDSTWLRRAQTLKLVRLDFAAIDDFHSALGEETAPDA